MPLTYHFRPLPSSGESHFEPRTQPTSVQSATPQCSCQKAVARCRQCRQQERDEGSLSSGSSQNMLPSIKEELDPLHRPLTPKAIREQRRAANRVSVSAAFDQSVGTEDYFTFYHSTAFARSPSASARPAYRSGRAGSHSRKSSAEQAPTPQAPTLESASSVDSIDSIVSAIGGEQDLSRRGS